MSLPLIVLCVVLGICLLIFTALIGFAAGRAVERVQGQR